jgi:hypothetical protein
MKETKLRNDLQCHPCLLTREKQYFFAQTLNNLKYQLYPHSKPFKSYYIFKGNH